MKKSEETDDLARTEPWPINVQSRTVNKKFKKRKTATAQPSRFRKRSYR